MVNLYVKQKVLKFRPRTPPHAQVPGLSNPLCRKMSMKRATLKQGRVQRGASRKAAALTIQKTNLSRTHPQMPQPSSLIVSHPPPITLRFPRGTFSRVFLRVRREAMARKHFHLGGECLFHTGQLDAEGLSRKLLLLTDPPETSETLSKTPLHAHGGNSQKALPPCSLEPVHFQHKVGPRERF